MKNQFDLVVFDWDGTLMDSIGWIVHCMKAAAIELKLAEPDDESVKSIIGLSIQKAIKTLHPELDDQGVEFFIQTYSEVFFSRSMSEDDLFPGVKNLLDVMLGQGFKLAVATGKSRNGLQKAMQATGLSEYFCVTRCANETASKPDPLMLEQILVETGVNRAKTVVVGDSVHDLQMASNANIASIAVACGANTQEQLQALRPWLSLAKTTDLIDVIRSNANG
jgi:phosphoglycolate phosphatase